MNEIVDGVNVIKRQNVIGCDLKSFTTSNPYANGEFISTEFTCHNNETLLFAFNRFETFDENDVLSMWNTAVTGAEGDSIIIFSKFGFNTNEISEILSGTRKLQNQLHTIGKVDKQ